jgi:hypothetical protein
MDTSQLKKYATQARGDFRESISARAKRIGVNETEIQTYAVRGDLLIIGEQTFPKEYKQVFDTLYREVNIRGFKGLVDEVAYTWFNRFVALRFMELHDYFPHGLRVLSSSDGDPTPQILRNPRQLLFSQGFNKTKAEALFEAGDKEEELYRMVLIAQCNELNTIMPFLFERVSDLSELLLPDNLLASDSIIRKLTAEIEESAWFEGVEIIGWIYQYYISEKKDEVIGRVVKSEDIPAATQLFTPNWIVKYLVQNSVGAFWLETYPNSALAEKMEYYIKPAEQEPAVLEELKKITPSEINPESITVLDPACGSGHILVEAYDVLKQIYLERGYRPREVPRLILEKNLFGLDIDGRAAQLASFALLMKARADDKSILSADHPAKLNILEIVEADFNIDEAVQVLTKGKDVKIAEFSEQQAEMPFMPKKAQTELPLTTPRSLKPSELKEFLELFKEAKTFGSLIQVPEELKGKIHGVERFAKELAKETHGTRDMFASIYSKSVLRICEQAKILGGVFDAVVANPPYMGSKYLNPKLKEYLKARFNGYDKDLFAAFIVHCFSVTKSGGHLSFMSPFVWMFISSYEKLRQLFVEQYTVTSLIQLEYSGFAGATVPICTFALRNLNLPHYRGSYVKLSDFRGATNQAPKTLEAIRNRDCGWFYTCTQSDFSTIPGRPFAYWIGESIRDLFRNSRLFREIAEPRVGMQTANNEFYLRYWFEVNADEFLNQSNQLKWIKYLKGGPFRRWYGNLWYLLRYNSSSQFVLQQDNATILPASRLQEPKCTWTDLTSSYFSCRLAPTDSFHDISGHCFYPRLEDQMFLLAYANTNIFNFLLSLINSSFHYQVGDIARIPVPEISLRAEIESIAAELIAIHKADWDSRETSWDFKRPLNGEFKALMSDEIAEFQGLCGRQLDRVVALEARNNSIFQSACKLQYGSIPESSPVSIQVLESQDQVVQVLSHFVGCVLGRYSLDAPGLIYANSGNIGFDPSRYAKFPADADGVVPILDYPWFADDIITRFQEFLIACWSKDTLEENMKFVADNLEPNQGETPEETIRRYFCDDFFKNHLKMYKKRPIYWLFSSGKEKAFQALVYLHRYNEQTLSKMRTDYVLPLQGKMSNEEKRLDAQIDTASTPAERNRFKKELEKLKKKQIELRKFDELLHHYADHRISLDLDDGVKVNYGKFGALLAEVKQVTGRSEE